MKLRNLFSTIFTSALLVVAASAFAHPTKNAMFSGVRNAPPVTQHLTLTGMTIEIVYVGPMPRPAFLDHLAKTCGGSVQNCSVGESIKAIQTAMAALPQSAGVAL